MSEVGERIKLRDLEATKKWCITNDVTVHKISKRDYVYKIDLECTIGKPFVADLKKKYPQKWKNLLKGILSNDALYNLLLENLDEASNVVSLTVVKPMDSKEQKLYKELIS